MNKRKKVAQLIQGLQNLDRTKSEIETFVKIVAYFLTHASVSNFLDNPPKFNNGQCIMELTESRWIINVETDCTFNVIKAGIRCELSQVPKNTGWFLIYQYDAVKNVTNLQMNVSWARKVYGELPAFEEQLANNFHGWNIIVRPLIEASEMKF